MLSHLKGCNYFPIGFIYFLKMTILLHFGLHYRIETEIHLYMMPDFKRAIKQTLSGRRSKVSTPATVY